MVSTFQPGHIGFQWYMPTINLLLLIEISAKLGGYQLQISFLPSALWERQKGWEFPPPNGSMSSPTESQWEAMQSNLAQVIWPGNRLQVVGLVFRAPHVWKYSQGGYVGNKTIRGAMGESDYCLDYPSHETYAYTLLTIMLIKETDNVMSW